MAPKRWLVMRPIPVTWVSVQWQEGRSTLNRARRFSHLQFMTEAASMMRHLHLPELLTSAATWKEHKGFWLLASFNLCRSSNWLFIFFHKTTSAEASKECFGGSNYLKKGITFDLRVSAKNYAFIWRQKSTSLPIALWSLGFKKVQIRFL